MIKLTKTGRIAILTFLLVIAPGLANAEIITNDDGNVIIDITRLADGTVILNSAKNEYPRKVDIKVDGSSSTEKELHPNESIPINKKAKLHISYAFPGSTPSDKFLWKPEPPATPKIAETVAQVVTEESKVDVATTPAVEPTGEKSVTVQSLNAEGGYPMVLERLNRDSFFGIEAVASYTQKVDSFTQALSTAENKNQFLIDNDIEQFLNDSKDELNSRKGEIPLLAQDIVVSTKITDSSSQSIILSSVIDILNNRYNQREAAFNKLQTAVNALSAEGQGGNFLNESVINYAIIGVIVLVLLIWSIIAIRKRKKKAKARQQSTVETSRPDSDSGNPAIVVRRRTTSILKKQSIDDVINNPEYMQISSSDFTQDSAVRNIYIKNTCIKDVYNMYAEDLRNSDNPKEDGCMVLGRWVQNDNTHTYDISLESVVLPGDDAVFKEYELNFGGKIKLRIAEKLRKLRRETNLQYDLVCWIHSHPGLGVFFSNSDDNVQMQLKHSQHPNFLIAFVIDILTSSQEMGIFTFRKDGSMNSKGDITKMYSLEDMYKWALESYKAAFNPDNYYNILNSAKMRLPSFNGIELNNSSIIDLTQRAIDPETGIVGWAVGTSIDVKGNKEFVVSGIVKNDEKPSAGVIGVLLNVTHMSLPTIQRLIANESKNLSFVMVYSSRQNIVTSIPVINGELIIDEHFYGEETIDDLKIWTRRKR